jgi:hypothetical protein
VVKSVWLRPAPAPFNRDPRPHANVVATALTSGPTSVVEAHQS